MRWLFRSDRGIHFDGGIRFDANGVVPLGVRRQMKRLPELPKPAPVATVRAEPEPVERDPLVYVVIGRVRTFAQWTALHERTTA